MKYIRPTLDKKDLVAFLEVLPKEYASRHNAKVAISWAYHDIGKRSVEYLRTGYSPSLVMVGQEYLPTGAGYVEEVLLGELIMIQPGIVIFFTAENLFNGSGEYFCGKAIPDRNEEDNFRVNLSLKEGPCEIFDEKGKKYLICQLGWDPHAMAKRYRIEDNMCEKIEKFLKKYC